MPNLVCGYNLEWRSVAFYFGVTLTSFMNNRFRSISPILFAIGILNRFMDASGFGGM